MGMMGEPDTEKASYCLHFCCIRLSQTRGTEGLLKTCWYRLSVIEKSPVDLLAVFVEPPADLFPQVTGIDIFPQEWARPVFGIAKPLVKNIHNR